MESFKAKVGPLPVWAWGLVVTGMAAAVFYWRSRSSSTDSSGSTADQSGINPDDAVTSAQLAQLGYLGYGDFGGTLAGNGSTGNGTDTGTGGSTGTGSGSTKNPPTTPGNCRMAKDPSGTWRHICGVGHWFKKKGQPHWYWTPGPIPNKGLHNPGQYRPGPPLIGGGTVPIVAGSLNPQPRVMTGAAATSRAAG